MSSGIANLFPVADVVGDASSSSASDVASSSDLSIKQKLCGRTLKMPAMLPHLLVKKTYNFIPFLRLTGIADKQYRVLDTGEHDDVALWMPTVKQANHSVNKSSDKPVKMMHLLVHAAAGLKVWSEYKEVCKRGDLAAAVVNHILVKNHVFVLVKGKP